MYTFIVGLIWEFYYLPQREFQYVTLPKVLFILCPQLYYSHIQLYFPLAPQTLQVIALFLPQDLSYKDKHWHEACFLCFKCNLNLVDKQFGAKADKIYCGNCYDTQFASRCDGCGEVFRAGKQCCQLSLFSNKTSC